LKNNTTTHSSVAYILRRGIYFEVPHPSVNIYYKKQHPYPTQDLRVETKRGEENGTRVEE